MEVVHEETLQITIHEEAKETNGSRNPDTITQSRTTWLGKNKRWVEIVINGLLVQVSQSAATILGRLYYEKGGKSKWLATLVQTIGFPLIYLFLWINKKESRSRNDDDRTTMRQYPASPTLFFLSVYVFPGVIFGGCCALYSIGLSYLPVSTFTIISASQLGFNALFSFFLNSQKITPLIANSIVLLAISTILLVIQANDSSTQDTSLSSKRTCYMKGFICTLIASAGYALLLSSTEFIFRKIIRKQTMKHMMDVVIRQYFIATCGILLSLLASGDWKYMKEEMMIEMQEFELGKSSYVMILVGTTISWQVFSIGLVVLIMKVSALFANVISTLAVPLVTILALTIFHEKMSGLKVVSIILAIWGFSSYTYQLYLDGLKIKAETVNGNDRSEVSVVESG